MEIKIKYHSADMPRIEKIIQGDWIDLRAAEDIELKAGEFKLIPLGVSIELPSGYEALLAPRSSTFKKHGIIQTNSVGVVDESYCGDNDQWFMPVYATRDVKIEKFTRLCQFRIIEHQPKLNIIEVSSLNNSDRGGHGSTGTM